ncbi:MAG TPA: hypothetical protein VIG99_06270 [Myxococcaceae bacterium]|jgi:hypothetical protein
MADSKDKDKSKSDSGEKPGVSSGVDVDLQPVDIIRWPNLEHRFNADSALRVGLTTPVNVGFGESPVRVGFAESPANVNMNILTPNAVGVNLLGSSSPIALRLVIPEEEQLIVSSQYNISLKINGNEVLSVAVGGRTTIYSQNPNR